MKISLHTKVAFFICVGSFVIACIIGPGDGVLYRVFPTIAFGSMICTLTFGCINFNESNEVFF